MKHALRHLLCAAVCWTALSGAPLRAQQPSGEEAIEALRANYRPALLQGNPLNLVGIDLRAATPMLAHGERTPLQVDIETSHKRALAMYGSGARFHVALPSASKGPRSEPTAPQGALAQDPAPEEDESQAMPWSLLAGVAASALLIVWFFMRVRPALVAPRAEDAPAAEAFVWRPTRRAKKPKLAPHKEQPAPLPRKGLAVDNGARVSKHPKRR